MLLSWYTERHRWHTRQMAGIVAASEQKLKTVSSAASGKSDRVRMALASPIDASIVARETQDTLLALQ
jgi:hypothetical protein